MDYFTKQKASSLSSSASYDAGLRSFMLSVYNYMGIGLTITGLVAFFISQSPALIQLLFTTPLQWVVMFAPLIVVFFVMPKIYNFSLSGAQMTFWGFCALMGASLSWIFIAYTGESVARVFFITAATFGTTSLYGYTTKRDLSQFGSFLIMGLIGIIIASLVNIFLQSSAMQFVISIVGVLVFVGLTAYDTQRIKEVYYSVSGHGDVASKTAIYGALSLYMDFINLFIMLLQLLGDRR